MSCSRALHSRDTALFRYTALGMESFGAGLLKGWPKNIRIILFLKIKTDLTIF